MGVFIGGKEERLFSASVLEEALSSQLFKKADPFPHIVIDGMFETSILNRVLDEWPEDLGASGEHHDDGIHVIGKTGSTYRTSFGEITRQVFVELASPSFLSFLQELTGMWGLIGDPYMFGGGLHATKAGGRLNIHADYNKHPIFKLDRRINLLTYLNPGWTEENSGHLELWDRDMRECRQRILPIFNRTVIFATTSTSFHGQPNEIVGGDSCIRRSLALYYFSNGRADEGFPPDVGNEHSTIWMNRPT